MNVYDVAARLMSMDDQTWARHANPASGYTRIIGGTALFFAIYAIHWIGWLATLPIFATLAWLVINPRAFAPPKDARSWMTRGVLGERVFMNRAKVPIPSEFVTACNLLTGASAAFLAMTVYGFITDAFWLAFTAWHAAALAKLCFVDRCAWLLDIMKEQHQTYKAWSNADFRATL